jgi:hypothetical protein
MSDEQINIAIAEACGYKNVTIGVTEGAIRVVVGYKHHTFDEEIPNYCNDLNAMHEAVLSVLNVASSQLNWDYCRILGEVTGSGEHVTTALVHATAAQRAEAFLRTINKWEGGSDE